MKTALFSAFAAVALLASSTSFAAAPGHDHDRDNFRNDRNHHFDQGPRHRISPRERARWEAERHNNYGYDRYHRVTPREQARWEAAHRY